MNRLHLFTFSAITAEKQVRLKVGLNKGVTSRRPGVCLAGFAALCVLCEKPIPKRGSRKDAKSRKERKGKGYGDDDLILNPLNPTFNRTLEKLRRQGKTVFNSKGTRLCIVPVQR